MHECADGLLHEVFDSASRANVASSSNRTLGGRVGGAGYGCKYLEEKAVVLPAAVAVVVVVREVGPMYRRRRAPAAAHANTRGLTRRAHAMAVRCFYPPLRRTPRSPASAAHQSGKASMNPSATAGRWRWAR